ncbi:ribosome-associated translation inhibitor RaiA [Flavobacteriales bacterium]|nr:ribosome-associated translation inhibitor RaiA [Flavobacteriales bacterium]
MDIQIQAIHFDADEKLVDFVEDKVERLSQYYDNIIGAEVKLKVEKAGSHENKVIEIKIAIPGKDLFASKQCNSFEESADEAVEALRRQIKKHKEKLTAKH